MTLKSLFYFIPSSEFNAYLKPIKVLLSMYSEKICEEYDLYFFTAAKRDYFDNSGLNSRIAPFVSDITLRMYARQIKHLTSHFDATFELT